MEMKDGRMEMIQAVWGFGVKCSEDEALDLYIELVGDLEE